MEVRNHIINFQLLKQKRIDVSVFLSYFIQISYAFNYTSTLIVLFELGHEGISSQVFVVKIFYNLFLQNLFKKEKKIFLSSKWF